MVAVAGYSAVVLVGRDGEKESTKLEPISKLWHEGEGDDGAYTGGDVPNTVDLEPMEWTLAVRFGEDVVSGPCMPSIWNAK